MSALVTLECHDAQGRTLDVLAQLIEARSKVLGESLKDALTATAIQALKSVRAGTRKHGKGKIAIGEGTDITIAESAASHTTFYRVGPRNFRRTISSGGHPVYPVPKTLVQIVPPGKGTWERARVFDVHVSADRQDRWPFQHDFQIVASSESAVVKYAQKRYSAIAARQGGLARAALSNIMGAISTRPAADSATGAHAATVANRNYSVQKGNAGNGYFIYAYDNLKYAADAIVGGRGMVDVALQRACNAIAGRLRKASDGFFAPTFPTPFPEVKRK